MRKFHDVFLKSVSIAKTGRALQAEGLAFAGGSMEGDYYTPVDPKLAATWLAASKLDGFGLSHPPVSVFRREEAAKAAD